MNQIELITDEAIFGLDLSDRSGHEHFYIKCHCGKPGEYHECVKIPSSPFMDLAKPREKSPRDYSFYMHTEGFQDMICDDNLRGRKTELRCTGCERVFEFNSVKLAELRNKILDMEAGR